MTRWLRGNGLIRPTRSSAVRRSGLKRRFPACGPTHHPPARGLSTGILKSYPGVCACGHGETESGRRSYVGLSLSGALRSSGLGGSHLDPSPALPPASASSASGTDTTTEPCGIPVASTALIPHRILVQIVSRRPIAGRSYAKKGGDPAEDRAGADRNVEMRRRRRE